MSELRAERYRHSSEFIEKEFGMKSILFAILGCAISAELCLAEPQPTLHVVTLEIAQQYYDSVIAAFASLRTAPHNEDGSGARYEPFGVSSNDDVLRTVRELLDREIVQMMPTDSGPILNGPAWPSSTDPNVMSQPIISVTFETVEDGSFYVGLKSDVLWDGGSGFAGGQGLSMGPGPFRQRVLPGQTVILETGWNVPQPEPERKKLFGVVALPRLRRKPELGPRRLVLLTPKGPPIARESSRSTTPTAPEATRAESTEPPRVQTLLRAVQFLRQAGKHEEAEAVYAEVYRLRSTVRFHQIASTLSQRQQESAALTQQIALLQQQLAAERSRAVRQIASRP